ncbi:hypothetical protein OPV22_026712 [Ensete ventricosum]|uniref:PB1 domain-containing protein n=1 Tax=Ensete ventricosum TaxID=4639 RepID=A0AAV8PQC0_ENSVE|nr:hypothetical protein OPV22_026712 [Ensete ventricosum]
MTEPAATAISEGGVAPGYAASVDSSPSSRGGDSWDEPFSSSAVAAVSSRLRMMCSYGGRIVPRPTDRALCYLGGETRMVVVDRNSSLADLTAKLSRDLLGGLPFSLKYQLPNEDLDSLISVATDEDLENMIEEFDRISAAAGGGAGAGGSTRSPRLRLFLFPSKPESEHSSTIGSLLDESKSETWFVDALNSAIGCMRMDGLPRDFSADSASINGILGLEDNSSVHSRSGGGGAHREPEQLGLHRPDSSGKLPRHGQEAHSVPDSLMLDKSSSFGSTSSAPSLSNLPPIPVPTDDRPPDRRTAGLDNHLAAHMHLSPDWTTSQRPNIGFKEPIYAPQRAPPPNPLPTDSASSYTISPTENSNRVFSDDERSEHAGLRKLPQPPKPTQIGGAAPDPASRPTHLNPNSDPKTEQLQQQQFHPHLYQQQPQFIPRNSHYIHHPAAAMPSYYHTAVHPTQQSPQAHPFDPQLPLYYMPVGHPMPYPLAAVQPNLADSNSVPSSSDLPPSLYRTAAPGPAPAALQPQLISVPSNQAHAYAGTGYHMYYSQASSQPALTPQYQTMSTTTFFVASCSDVRFTIYGVPILAICRSSKSLLLRSLRFAISFEHKVLGHYNGGYTVGCSHGAISWGEEPFHRFVGRDMMIDLKYPLKSNTVPFWAVPVIGIILPFVIFLAIYFRRRDVYDLHHAILGLLYSVLITGVITDAIKDAVGRPRPDFFWRCFPDGKEVYDNVTTNVICHGENSVIKEGHKSFPSGHSSWSFAGLGFLSWYLAGKIQAFDRRGHIAKLCIVLLPLLCASLVGISRVDDYWHHWQDVFAGGSLGLIVASFCYLQFFPPPHDANGWGPHAYFQTLGDTQSNTPMTHAANPLSIRSMEAEAGYIYTRQQG